MVWQDRRRRYDAVRETRGLRRRLDRLEFPPSAYPGSNYFHWKIPIGQGLVSGPTARSDFQAICAQVLIDASYCLAKRKPKGLEHTRVVTILGCPDLFDSEICVFFDPKYFASFTDRNFDDYRWSARSDAELVTRWSLDVPAEFAVRGFDTYERDDTFDPPSVTTGQTWLIGEVE